MTATVVCLAAYRAHRAASAPLILGRPPVWWLREVIALAALCACVALLIEWIA